MDYWNTGCFLAMEEQLHLVEKHNHEDLVCSDTFYIYATQGLMRPKHCLKQITNGYKHAYHKRDSNPLISVFKSNVLLFNHPLDCIINMATFFFSSIRSAEV